MTGLERRVGTALVYGVIVLSAVFAPPPTFVALVAILAALGYLELRVSNFLLWEVAYAEMWATPVLWPDFSVKDLDDALASYAERERRFGR